MEIASISASMDIAYLPAYTPSSLSIGDVMSPIDYVMAPPSYEETIIEEARTAGWVFSRETSYEGDMGTNCAVQTTSDSIDPPPPVYSENPC